MKVDLKCNTCEREIKRVEVNAVQHQNKNICFVATRKGLFTCTDCDGELFQVTRAKAVDRRSPLV